MATSVKSVDAVAVGDKAQLQVHLEGLHASLLYLITKEQAEDLRNCLTAIVGEVRNG